MIRDCRRGQELDSIVLTATDGRALHIIAYGLGGDEARRNREELIRWLTGTGIPLVDEEGRRL